MSADLSKFEYVSIEPEGACPVSGRPGEGFIVVGVYTAGSDSVMEGRQMRERLGNFETLPEARKAFPKAEVRECPHNPMLDPPPAQFSVDPSIAGEVYGDDEY